MGKNTCRGKKNRLPEELIFWIKWCDTFQELRMKAQNLIEAFEQSAARLKDRVCFRFVEEGKWVNMSWNEVRDYITKVAGGLSKLGVTSGDRICILSKTRYEWTLADLGSMAAGAIVVPIYESTVPDQVEFIINNCGASVIFVENEAQLNKILMIRHNLPDVKQIISFEDVPRKIKRDGIYDFDEVIILGSENGEAVYSETLKKLMPESEASFVYTSGTTGNPKGAVLTHGNFMAEVDGATKVLEFREDYESLIFLPLAHIFARCIQFFQLNYGFIQCYAESIDKILDNIATIRPHLVGSVPRIFEKIHARTLQGVQASSPGKQKIFEWALAVGTERVRYVMNNRRVPLGLALKYKLAHKLVFSKLHAKLGGRIRFFISGGAPLSRDISEFFNAFGLDILEGYGLTETTAAITVNTFAARKLGSVGKTVPGVDIKIASDGEILVKGSLVFKGYYKNPEATAEAIDKDGYFHTGDIGQFDEEGFLAITDRKKDIIVTAAGKNIAPQNIENLMKNDPYISQFVVHGDRRKFLTALVTLDTDEVVKYAKSHNIPFANYNDLVSNEKIYNFIRDRINEKNRLLAKYETIKKFAILPSDFSVESGELTPTLKIKRKVVSQRYQNILDGFYQDGSGE